MGYFIYMANVSDKKSIGEKIYHPGVNIYPDTKGLIWKRPLIQGMTLGFFGLISGTKKVENNPSLPDESLEHSE